MGGCGSFGGCPGGREARRSQPRKPLGERRGLPPRVVGASPTPWRREKEEGASVRSALSPKEVLALVDDPRARTLLRALGLLTPRGGASADAHRKIKQITHLARLIAPAIEDAHDRHQSRSSSTRRQAGLHRPAALRAAHEAPRGEADGARGGARGPRAAATTLARAGTSALRSSTAVEAPLPSWCRRRRATCLRHGHR